MIHLSIYNAFSCRSKWGFEINTPYGSNMCRFDFWPVNLQRLPTTDSKCVYQNLCTLCQSFTHRHSTETGTSWSIIEWPRRMVKEEHFYLYLYFLDEIYGPKSVFIISLFFDSGSQEVSISECDIALRWNATLFQQQLSTQISRDFSGFWC